MGITERAAYLKGLVEGLDIDKSTKEGKLLNALVDVIDDMASAIADLEDVYDELDEAVDAIDEDLGELEDDFYGAEDDDECDCDCDDCCDDDECDCCGEDDEDLYEVTCPNCNDTIYLDEGMLEEGSIDCPNCGQLLEFEYDDDEETDEPEEEK
ncbi:MAG: CD1247 N-terminal domain-containing protein [Massiliimalia sp.]|jgi:hypothetical protein